MPIASCVAEMLPTNRSFTLKIKKIVWRVEGQAILHLSSVTEDSLNDQRSNWVFAALERSFRGRLSPLQRLCTGDKRTGDKRGTFRRMAGLMTGIRWGG